MKAKSILSLASALLLAASLCAPALAAARRPALICDGDGEGVLWLVLEDLDGTGIYGAQVELTLDGAYPDCTFTPSGRDVYSPDCVAEVRSGRTEVTLYLTDTAPLNRGERLPLGELDLGTGRGEPLPEAASVVLLGRDLQPLEGRMSGSVSIEEADEDDGGGSDRPSNRPGGGKDEPLPEAPDEIDGTDETVVLPFADVGPGDWFYEEVRYVYSRGMMGGTAPSAFTPGGTTTRAMVVTILHRMEGAPAAPAAPFTDVSAGQYYAVPVAWAASCGVVTGATPTTFNPEAPITRQQLAAILWRYAEYKGVDVSGGADLGIFPDADRVAPYAAQAMAWAVEAGLIAGVDGRLDPTGQATRAQTAVILTRMCRNVLALP